MTAKDQSGRRRWWRLWPAVAIVLWLLVGGPAGSRAGKASDVQQNDNAAFLPKSAESTAVLELNKRFVSAEMIPALVVYARQSGLTTADKEKITSDMAQAAAHLGAKLGQPPIGP